MPTYEITAPDGHTYEVTAPEGATEQQVLQYVQQNMQKPAAPAKTVPQSVKPQAPSGFMRGLRDPLDAGAQLLERSLPSGISSGVNKLNNWLASKGVPLATLPAGGVDQAVRAGEKEYQQQRQAAGETGVDWGRVAGNIVNPVNLAAASRLPAVVGGSRALAGALSGGAFGMAQPVAEEGDFWQQKAEQAGAGAAGGAAASKVVQGLSRVINPQTSKEVKTLLKAGVTPTPGQILGGRLRTTEDKLMSVPLLGDAISSGRKRAVGELNRAAYQRALDPIGGNASKLPIGREGIAAVKQQISQAYDDLLPKMNFRADKQFQAELGQLRQMAQGLAPTERAKFDTILNEHLSKLSPNGGMVGQTFQKVDSAISDDISIFSRSTDAYQQELANALKQLKEVFSGGLERNSPQYAKEYGKVKQAFANYARLRDAGSRAGDMSEGFTPSQLAAAVRGQDKTVGKGGTATGNALMQDLSDAGLTLNSKYPDSGTFGRLAMTGGLGYAGAMNPMIPATAVLGALPYSQTGQRLAAALLAKRPQAAQSFADVVEQAAPYLIPGAAFAGNALVNQ